MNWKVLVTISLIVLEILTISLVWKPTLPLTVYIVRVYDVGDIGYWDVVCSNPNQTHPTQCVGCVWLLW